ncbi:MAG: YceH family protein [Solirubrobacterales bacterium]
MEALDSAELRVLGCLLEKQQTTPDAYPLTLNSLRLACSQSTNRDPVVDYDEATVREAAQRLGRRGWARMASYHGSRSAKYRHLLDDALGLEPDERALLCVLMLRGPQTLGELKQRSERLHGFSDLASVEDALERLSARELGRWLERRPGHKEARYTHLLEDESADAREAVPADAPAPEQGPDRLSSEVAQLRRELDALRADVAALREQIGS